MWFIGVEVEQETGAPYPLLKKSWICPCTPHNCPSADVEIENPLTVLEKQSFVCVGSIYCLRVDVFYLLTSARRQQHLRNLSL